VPWRDQRGLRDTRRAALQLRYQASRFEHGVLQPMAADPAGTKLGARTPPVRLLNAREASDVVGARNRGRRAPRRRLNWFHPGSLSAEGRKSAQGTARQQRSSVRSVTCENAISWPDEPPAETTHHSDLRGRHQMPLTVRASRRCRCRCLRRVTRNHPHGDCPRPCRCVGSRGRATAGRTLRRDGERGRLPGATHPAPAIPAPPTPSLPSGDMARAVDRRLRLGYPSRPIRRPGHAYRRGIDLHAATARAARKGPPATAGSSTRARREARSRSGRNAKGAADAP
jgi:hypothetical protein